MRNESAALEGVKQTNNLTGVFELCLGDGLVYGLLCHPQRHSERLRHAVLCKQTRPTNTAVTFAAPCDLSREISQIKTKTKDVMSTTALCREVERWPH